MRILSREEMRNIFAGSELCDDPVCETSITCPGGTVIKCCSDTYCYSDGDGEYDGFVNCGLGNTIVGCWMREGPPSDPIIG